MALGAFKGTLAAGEATRAAAEALHQAFPGAEVERRPVADGGDSLLEVMRERFPVACTAVVRDPLARPVTAPYAADATGRVALIESRYACGLGLLAARERDPLRTTTLGVGDLLLAATARGARRLLVGLGGSATVDGGVGMAQALGWLALDSSGKPLAPGGGALLALERLVPGPPLRAEVVGIVDVTNPLLGDEGAARVFGPQKGADERGVELLAAGLARLAVVAGRDLGRRVADLAGGGAAGGLGAALVLFTGAELRDGAEWVLEETGFDRALDGASVVVTGEGRFDATSWRGKAAGAVLERARVRGLPAVLVAGSVAPGMAPEAAVVVAGEGDRALDAGDIAELAVRGVRLALRLPGPP